jgi:hypothetical protein
MQSRTSISDSGNLRAFTQPSTFNLQPTFSVACTSTPTPVRKKDQSHADRSIADGLSTCRWSARGSIATTSVCLHSRRNKQTCPNR